MVPAPEGKDRMTASRDSTTAQTMNPLSAPNPHPHSRAARARRTRRPGNHGSTRYGAIPGFEAPRDSARSGATGVPIALDGIIAKALAKDASTRYQNVEELPADLKAIDIGTLSKSRIATKPSMTIPIRLKRSLLLYRAVAGLMTLIAAAGLCMAGVPTVTIRPSAGSSVRQFPLPHQKAWTVVLRSLLMARCLYSTAGLELEVSFFCVISTKRRPLRCPARRAGRRHSFRLTANGSVFERRQN